MNGGGEVTPVLAARALLVMAAALAAIRFRRSDPTAE